MSKHTTDTGRIYEMAKQTTGEAAARHLIANGWDGCIYIGVSEPRGSQRKTMTSLFYRCATTGEFRPAA